MNALRALLDNLPAYGRRLLRRITKRRMGEARGVRRLRSAHLRRFAARRSLWGAAKRGGRRIERTDKSCNIHQVIDIKIFLIIGTRGEGVMARCLLILFYSVEGGIRKELSLILLGQHGVCDV